MRALKSIPNQALLFVMGMMLSLVVRAQTGTTGNDSVTFVRAKLNYDKFTYSDGVTREIRIKDDGTSLANARGKIVTRDTGSGLLTYITGINTVSSSEVCFKVAGTVICNDELPDWKLALYCDGTQEKIKHRVKSNSSSFPVQTETTNFYYWDMNATGFLVEGNDTVCFFMIVMHPREDSITKPMVDNLFLPEQVQETRSPNTIAQLLVPPSPIPIDYGIRGIFRGHPFVIISDRRQNKSWGFYNNNYLFMFYCGNQPGQTRKVVDDPYLLIKNTDSGPDRRDLFRLAMVCRFLNSTLGK